LHQIRCNHVLRVEDAVHSLKREVTPAVQKVGEVRLSEACLPGQKRDAERAPLYPAQKFQAESFVHLD
jgi:hypothetical protein